MSALNNLHKNAKRLKPRETRAMYSVYMNKSLKVVSEVSFFVGNPVYIYFSWVFLEKRTNKIAQIPL